MSTLKVDNIRHNSATSDAITMASDGTCTAKLTSVGGGQLSHRNIVVNGAMTVAQRGVSGTTSGYASVDRFETTYSGTDEAPTQSQHTLTSSDTGPYAEGFRYSYHVTNGNQTSGAGASDYVRLRYKAEAQDMALCGWNYTSASSFITLSFWVKASVTQTYYVQMRTSDGTNKSYYFPMNLSANTWTKVKHSIPGHADISFDNDTNEGIYIAWYPYRGTNNTGSGQDANQWNDWNGSTITPDQTTTWYTTNDATFEITGVQLEVGDTATSFEHLTFAENKRRCYRYCQRGRHMSSCLVGTPGTYYFTRANIPLFTPMRATVSGTLKAATWNSNRYFGYKTWSSETNVTAAPASVTFSSGSITGVPDILTVNLHISISSGSSNSPLPANGPGSNNVYPIELYDVLLEAEV